MKNKLTSVLLCLTSCLALMPENAFADTTLEEIRISSTTTCVEDGELEPFEGETTTEHVSIENYGEYTTWAKWAEDVEMWSRISVFEEAVCDGETHYGLCFQVSVDDGYELTEGETRIFFNEVEYTNEGNSGVIMGDGGMGLVVVDLGVVEANYDEDPVSKYRIMVNGEILNEENAIKGIACGDGKATYDAETNTLTLVDAKITDSKYDAGIYAEEGLNIVLEGNNEIALKNPGEGISVGDDLCISGDGSLEVCTSADDNAAIWSEYGYILIEMDGELKVQANNTGILAKSDITFWGGGNADIKSAGTGIESLDGSVDLTGSGDIEVVGEETSAVKLNTQDSKVHLNGKSRKISFKSEKGSAISTKDSECPVDGASLDKYNVTGAPDKNSVVYELKTNNKYSITNGADKQRKTEKNGYLKIDKETAAAGETIKVEAIANDGYEIVEKPYYIDKAGNQKIYGEFKNGSYVFTMPNYDIKIIARFASAFHKVTVSADESMGHADSPKQSYKTGTTVNLTYKPNKGYKFVRWESSDVEITNNSFTMPDHDVTVTAVFEKIVTYKIIVRANDGRMGQVIVSSRNATKGTTVDIRPVAERGYEFVRWETSDVTIVNNSFVMPGNDVDIEAVFKKSEPVQHNITVKVNDDSMGKASASEQKAIAGKKVTLSAHPEKGYKFVRWESLDVKITNNTFTMPDHKITVKAVFEKIVTYDVNVNVNDSDMGEAFASSRNATKGTKVNLVAKAYSGYEFVRWETSDVIIKNNTFIMPDKSVTVKAVFEKSQPAKHDVVVKANDDNMGKVPASSYSSPAGAIITLTATANDGYRFVRWQSKDVNVDSKNMFTMPNKKVTVTAVFEKIATYTVDVKVNDVRMGTASSLQNDIAQGTKVTLTANANDGYKFVRWESTDVTVKNDTFIMPGKSVTVKAVFEKIQPAKHDVVVKANDDNMGKVSASSYSSPAGAIITLTATANDGYRFVRWQSKDVNVDSKNMFTMPNKKVTVTAVFEKVVPSTYDISVNINDEKMGTASASANIAKMGDTITLTAVAKEGFKFDHWESKDVKISKDGKFTMPAFKVTVKAVFKAERYKVWVNGEEFTGSNVNSGIVCGQGTAFYDPDTRTLTLCNATLNKINSTDLGGMEYGSSIYSESDLNIVVTGNNTINLDKDTSGDGIWTKGDLTISGNGNLNIVTEKNSSMGISNNKGKIDITMNGVLTIKTEYTCIFSKGNVTISGNSVIDLDGDYYGIYVNSGNVVLSGSGIVDISGKEYCGILLMDRSSSVLLEGDRTPISITGGSEAVFNERAKSNPVAGKTFADYDVEGSPAETSVVYTLKSAKPTSEPTATPSVAPSTTPSVTPEPSVAPSTTPASTPTSIPTVTPEPNSMPEPVQYAMLDGADNEWTKGDPNELVFRSEATFDKFVCVKIDGVEIDASNFTAEEGSTIIKLHASYLETLSIDKHSIEIVSKDGRASTRFLIKGKSNTTPLGSPAAPDKTPKTGDSSKIALWAVLLVVSLGAVIGLNVKGKKRKRTE